MSDEEKTNVKPAQCEASALDDWLGEIATMEHKKWKSIYRKKPKDKAICVSRISGEEGYCGSCIYDADTATFRTYEDKRNTLVITVWKHDEWYYA